MKVLIISDLHGKSVWKNAVKEHADIDKYLFHGDYLDSFTHLNIEIKDNFEDVINFKKANPDKVELLLGNHDINFFFDDAPLCSGHRGDMKMKLRADLINDNIGLFQVAYQ